MQLPFQGNIPSFLLPDETKIGVLLLYTTHQLAVILKISLVTYSSILMTKGMDFMAMLSKRVRSIAGWVPNVMIMLEQWYF
jgi:hypothetical protein